MLTIEKINKLIEVEEGFHASYKLTEIMSSVEEREKLFEKFLFNEPVLSFDWFTEYYQSEHSDRVSKKQDFTPDSVNSICNLILGETKSNADICAGSGGMTIKRWNENKKALFYCEELSDRAIPFLLFNLSIRNINGYILHGDSLKKEFKIIYKLTSSNKFSDIEIVESIEEILVETVVMNPPYSLEWSQIKDSRFNSYGIAPKSKADLAFLLHGLSKLSENGQMAIVLPHGVLFRAGAEQVIRKQLIYFNKLDSVIGLPAKLFYNTDIPTCILVLKKNKINKDILFIDASNEFTKNKAKNDLEDFHINKILDIYQKRKELKKYSHVATLDEVKENDYNLNLPRYVDTYIKQETKPFNEIIEDMKGIDRLIEKNSQELATMMLDLVGTNEVSDKLIKDFAKYFSERHGTRPLEVIEVIEVQEKKEVKKKENKKMEQISIYD